MEVEGTEFSALLKTQKCDSSRAVFNLWMNSGTKPWSTAVKVIWIILKDSLFLFKFLLRTFYWYLSQSSSHYLKTPTHKLCNLITETTCVCITTDVSFSLFLLSPHYWFNDFYTILRDFILIVLYLNCISKQKQIPNLWATFSVLLHLFPIHFKFLLIPLIFKVLSFMVSWFLMKGDESILYYTVTIL